MKRKIILFELNEVPSRIIDQFCQWRPSSWLASSLPGMRKFNTYAEDVAPLSPWITWPTLHRGVGDEEHGILNFGQDLTEVNKEHPPVWQLLTAHGVSVGLCGSLHSYPMPDRLDNYRFYIPDTFAAGSECFPKYVAFFQELNLRMASQSARNVSSKIPWAAALRFLLAAPGLGVKMETFVDLGVQMVSERIKQARKVRRRTFQAMLAFDVFMRQLEISSPDFATFFTNHVASSMHRYWAATFPAEYDSFGFDESWVKTYCREIDWTMIKADQLLRRLSRFVDRHPEYQIWICTSMGQAATQAKPIATELYVQEMAVFMGALGIEPGAWERRPAMSPQYTLSVAPHKADTFRCNLSQLLIEGKPVRVDESANNVFTISIGHANVQSGGATLRGSFVPFQQLGLGAMNIEDLSSATAYHIPQGCLYIYDSLQQSPRIERTQISTSEIAPTILKQFSVPIPSYMKPPLKLAA